MAEAIVNFFRSIFHNDYITTLVVSAIPLVELRGSIPLAVSMGIDPLVAFLLSYLGACVICVLLYFLLKPLLSLLKRIKFFNKFACVIEEIIKQKASQVKTDDSGTRVRLMKGIGVGLFVAVPLPLTGAWTGTAVAVFLDMPFVDTLLAIMGGNLIAGAILTLLSVFLYEYIDTILLVFCIIVVLVLLYYIIRIAYKMKKINK